MSKLFPWVGGGGISPDWSAGGNIAQFMEAIMSCYHYRPVKVVLPQAEGWMPRLCKVPVCLVIPRHSDPVTKKK